MRDEQTPQDVCGEANNCVVPLCSFPVGQGAVVKTGQYKTGQYKTWTADCGLHFKFAYFYFVLIHLELKTINTFVHVLECSRVIVCTLPLALAKVA